MDGSNSSMGVPAIHEMKSKIRKIAAIETIKTQPCGSRFQILPAAQNQMMATIPDRIAPSKGVPMKFKRLKSDCRYRKVSMMATTPEKTAMMVRM